MKSYYLNNDVLEALVFQAWSREVWLKDCSPRPLKADNVGEMKSLIERYGVDQPFSIYMSIEEFSEPGLLGELRPEQLRIGWDWAVDLDSEDFEASRRAAAKALKVLDSFGLTYLVKFSGRRGFHIHVPGRVFQVGSQREWLDSYPRLPSMLAIFLEACIGEPKVKLDPAIYKPRALLKCAYSLHEKTGYVAVPLDDPLGFKISDAKPEAVKPDIDRILLKTEVGSGLELLEAASDWMRCRQRNLEPAVKVIKYGRREVKPYRWVEKLLKRPIDDGRHRIIWLIVAPYLVNILGLPLEEAYSRAAAYLESCSRIKPVEGDINRLAHYYVEYAARRKLKPLSLQTLRSKEEYRDLWLIVKKVLHGSNPSPKKWSTTVEKRGDGWIPLPGGGFKKPSIVIKTSLRKPETIYEIEPALLEVVKAKLKQIDERFRRYPERALEDHRFRGYLGEQIFHMVLNDLDILHSYRDPLLQDAEIRKRRKAKADFRVGEDLVEVKTSCSRKKPKKLWVRKSRWLRHKADILVFIWIDREFKEGRILGWLPGSEIASFKTVEKRDGVCYEIPRARLKPFYKLLERWKYEPEQFIVERQ